MLVLEGILINVFETPKGVTKDGKKSTVVNQKFRSCTKNVGKRRKTHGNGDFDRFRYLTLPWQEKRSCACSCGFKACIRERRILKRQFEPVWGGCRADEAHPKQGEKKKRRFWRS